MTDQEIDDVFQIAERLRAVLNDGLSSVAICNKNDLRAILDDRERLEKAAIAEQKYSHSLERSISDSKARISQLGANACRGSTTTSPLRSPNHEQN